MSRIPYGTICIAVTYIMKIVLFATVSVLLLLSPALAVEYESDILPIFQAKCAKCHMDGSSKGGVALDLDKVEKEIGAGKAIVPADLEKSDLFEVVTLPDDDGDKMPPEGKGRPLSDGEIAKLKEWIESGAKIGNEDSTMEKEDKTEELSQRPEPIDGNWTNTSGKTIQATLVRVDGDKAILRMKGKDYPYPINNLDSESQAIIRKFDAAWKKASGQ